MLKPYKATDKVVRKVPKTPIEVHAIPFLDSDNYDTTFNITHSKTVKMAVTSIPNFKNWY